MVNVRNAKIEDLPQVVAVEHLCFSKADAATEEALKKRIQNIPDTFWVAEENGVIVGIINGPVVESEFITDDLFRDIQPNPSTGGHQTILGLAVAPNYQKRGIASKLLIHLEKEAQVHKRKSITLTCKEHLIPFYQQHGYHNDGISSSQHGGATWYNMSKSL